MMDDTARRRSSLTAPMRNGLLLVGTASAAAFMVGVAVDDWMLRMVAKPWPVVAMVVALVLGAPHRYGRLLAAGLVASLAGDMLLETGDSTFLPGVGAFFVAHVLYVAAYVRRWRRPALPLAVPFAVWIALILAYVWDGLGALRVPVTVYAAMIGVMMWRAAAAPAGAPRWRDAAWAACVGALMFGLSDSLIALTRFGGPIEGSRYAIMGLYWLGQLGITRSALLPDDEAPAT
jgi:alkenylglycerophosphocholine/alkenylglycerophosphoethanolamine hydrolase